MKTGTIDNIVFSREEWESMEKEGIVMQIHNGTVYFTVDPVVFEIVPKPEEKVIWTKLCCPKPGCAKVAANSRALGLHMKFTHGVPGKFARKAKKKGKK